MSWLGKFLGNKNKTDSEPIQEFYHPWENPYHDLFYDEMSKVEESWSVIYNFKSYDSSAASDFEKLCYKNIDTWKHMKAVRDSNGYYEYPKHVPGYVRLAMLYERRGEWEAAIDICAEAIKEGAYQDGNKSTMRGRLARYLSKAGLPAEKYEALLRGNDNGNSSS
jgi:hypothetical protein